LSACFDIALLGNGTLAKSFRGVTKHNVTVYSRPDIDFILPCDDWVSSLTKHDVILNTIGINKGNIQDIFQINFLTPVYILEKLVELDYKGKVIFVGSHGATWTSWPGIDRDRLNYNVSKANLKTYILSLSQSNLIKFQVTLFDTTKFQSQMSSHEGSSADSVSNLLEQIIDETDLRVLHLETY
jgi:hypothetical protein